MASTDMPMEDTSDADALSTGNGSSISIGPSIGVIKSGRPYLHESTIRRKLASLDMDLSRDAAARLQVPSLHTLLPAATITASALNLILRVSSYTFPYRPGGPNSLQLFDQGSKLLISLERQVIETLRFDFQVRNPFKILAKIVKAVLGSDRAASDFFVEAWKVGTDMYKTFAPLKYTTFTCAFAVARLTALITGLSEDTFVNLDPAEYHTYEEWVAEVMLDVLDLYTDNYRSTLLGKHTNPQVFIDVKISVNQRMETAKIPRYQNYCSECEREGFSSPAYDASATSPASPLGTNSTIKRGSKGYDGTYRFLFDAYEVGRERAAYDQYTKDEWDEWEEEVEELIPERDSRRRTDLGPEPRAPPREPRGDLGPEPRAPPREPRGSRGHRGHGRGRGRGRGGHDPGWNPRNRHDHRGRGRGGGGGSFY
ncbi:hypothetical protein RRF57_010489 [Xylaria bambusicola]|uniref:Uncharacterized protein n=1 Tax=Xylaria bambusicola TaxID=326684 RepID=A0AAN7ZCM8_9PEZI